MSESSKPYPPEGDIVVGTVRFDDKEQLFCINMGADYDDTYDMEADRILSGSGFLDFLFQIHSKKWATAQHLKDLLDCVSYWLRRDHGKLPQEFYQITGGMNRGLDRP